MHSQNVFRCGGLALTMVFALTACDKAADPTSPSIQATDFQPSLTSSPQVTPVGSVPQSRPYPGTKIVGEASVCKDAASPGGTYTFTVSTYNAQPGDMVASGPVTLTAGECKVVFNRVNRTVKPTAAIIVLITEVIPGGATYHLDHAIATDDGTADPRTVNKPAVAVLVNAYHGAYVTFYNVSNVLIGSTPYPGVETPSQAKLCKSSDSPAGTFDFTITATDTRPTDQVATTAALQAGECVIIFAATQLAPGGTPATLTVTETLPADANVDLASITKLQFGTTSTITGTRTASVAANFYHGGVLTFNNIATNAPPFIPIVDLKTASPYGILAGTTVTCVDLGTVNASIGISPGSSLTGFGPCTLTGTKDLANTAAALAQLDLTAAYNILAGLPCSPSNVITADLGGTTKAAGVYCSATSLGITGVLTLDGGGDPNATFVFQAGSTLTTAGSVNLINGAQAKNVFFQVGSSATIGTSSSIKGSILALASITLNDNVTLTGRALARNAAVTLGTGVTINLP